MFRMRRVGLYLAIAAMAAACTSGPRTKLMVVITPSLDDPFFAAESEAASARARALGYEVLAQSHDDDPRKQDELVDAAIARRAAAIILDHAGGDASVAAVARAKAARVPVFLIDRQINTTGSATAQIFPDNDQGARLAAEEFARLLAQEGDYLELVGRESDANAGVRSRGYHNVLDHLPSMKMVGRETANWSEDEAAKKIETMIRANRGIKGVIAGNDRMALGAATALGAAGLPKVVVVGFDGTLDAIAAINDGRIRATVLQPAGLIARMAVDQAHRFLNTGSTGQPEKQSVSCELVTWANADQFEKFGRK
jgi:erythritol transport system substrate-binding protein